MERKWDNWERRARLWERIGREIERQRPKNCSGDRVTVRCAAAAVGSLVSTNGQNYIDFPTFQFGWGREKRGLEVREKLGEAVRELHIGLFLTLPVLVCPLSRWGVWRW